MPNICVFEDEGYRKLLPLVYTRPVYDLRCGITTLLDKIIGQYPNAAVDLNCRDYLAPIVKRNHLVSLVNKISTISSCLFINGRILAQSTLSKKMPVSGGDEVFIKGSDVVGARLSKENLEFLKEKLSNNLIKTSFDDIKSKVKVTEVDVRLISYPWELIIEGGKQITEDFKMTPRGRRIRGKIHQSAVIYEKNNVFIDEGSEIMAMAVLDARGGPIYIGKGAAIYPHSRIEGPAFIGEKSTILGGKIRKGCSFGQNCRVGGEVEDTIIYGYSNKQHDGFLGHSYIGEWVNLGAGTTTSDLKNNYGHVKLIIAGEEIDSGEMFVGSFIGDHSKTGIGILLNTGTVIGVASNIFGIGIPPKYIPSFSWGGEKLEEHRLEDAIDTAKIVMSRRDVVMSEENEKLLRKIFEITSPERKLCRVG